MLNATHSKVRICLSQLLVLEGVGDLAWIEENDSLFALDGEFHRRCFASTLVRGMEVN